MDIFITNLNLTFSARCKSFDDVLSAFMIPLVTEALKEHFSIYKFVIENQPMWLIWILKKKCIR